MSLLRCFPLQLCLTFLYLLPGFVVSLWLPLAQWGVNDRRRQTGRLSAFPTGTSSSAGSMRNSQMPITESGLPQADFIASQNAPNWPLGLKWKLVGNN